MARKRNGGGDPPPAGAPAWMMTYGDMVTQILAFFVLLFSFSSINEQKFRETLISLQGAFGVLPGSQRGTAGALMSDVTSAESKSPQIRDPQKKSVKDNQLQAVAERAEKVLQSEGLQKDITVRYGEKDITLEFNAQALFDSGRADIKPEAERALDVLAAFLNGIPNEVRIEGHTDSDPISTLQFPSNWELSGARAANVLRFLADFGQIPAKRLSFAGYADWRPVAPNDTPANKAKNRRVDIVILSLGQ